VHDDDASRCAGRLAAPASSLLDARASIAEEHRSSARVSGARRSLDARGRSTRAEDDALRRGVREEVVRGGFGEFRLRRKRRVLDAGSHERGIRARRVSGSVLVHAFAAA